MDDSQSVGSTGLPEWALGWKRLTTGGLRRSRLWEGALRTQNGKMSTNNRRKGESKAHFNRIKAKNKAISYWNRYKKKYRGLRRLWAFGVKKPQIFPKPLGEGKSGRTGRALLLPVQEDQHLGEGPMTLFVSDEKRLRVSSSWPLRSHLCCPHSSTEEEGSNAEDSFRCTLGICDQ